LRTQAAAGRLSLDPAAAHETGNSLPSTNTHAAIEWQTLTMICRMASKHFDIPLVLLDGVTRIDDLDTNELLIVDFITTVETTLHCDIPDIDVSTTLTLAQLATLAEKYRVKT